MVPIYLITFTYENKNWLLYSQDSFVGSENEAEAHKALEKYVNIMVSVNGRVEKFDFNKLGELIGGVPFKIIDFFGGLGTKWEGVQLV